MRSGRPRGILWSEFDLFVFFQSIRGIDDNAVREIDSLKHFQGIAKVPPDREFLKNDSVFGADDGGHGSIRAEQKRVNGQGEPLAGNLNVKMHFRVRPWQEGSGGVRDIHFRQEGSSVGIDGVCRTNDLPAETPLREFR